MAASDPVYLAQQIADLERRLSILERTDQLASSSVTLPGGSIAVGDAVGAAVDASEATTELAGRIASNEDAVTAASALADAASAAAAEAGELGLAAGQQALDAAAAASTAADEAQSNASDALAAAQRAETSADGKSANTYSTSAPPSPDPDSATRSDGDSWYVITSTGNLIGIYRWSSASSSWVQGILTGGAVGNLDAGVIVSGYIAAARIAANTITSAMVQADAITAREIAAATITSAEIAAQTILAANIAGNTITAAQIAANTITAAQIKAGTITANEIAANAITAAQIAAGAVTATSLAAGAIDGITITGSTIRTAPLGNNRVELISVPRTSAAFNGIGFITGDGANGSADARVASITPLSRTLLNGGSSKQWSFVRMGAGYGETPDADSNYYDLYVGKSGALSTDDTAVALWAPWKGAAFGRPIYADALYPYNGDSSQANGGSPIAGVGVMPSMYARAQANQTVANGSQAFLALPTSTQLNGMVKSGSSFFMSPPGWYAISLSLIHANTSSTGLRTLSIYYGSTVMASTPSQVNTAAGMSISAVLYLDSPSTLATSFQILQNTGASLVFAVQQASIRYLGPS